MADHRVVVIGGSAGGVEALTRLVRAFRAGPLMSCSLIWKCRDNGYEVVRVPGLTGPISRLSCRSPTLTGPKTRADPGTLHIVGIRRRAAHGQAAPLPMPETVGTRPAPCESVLPERVPRHLRTRERAPFAKTRTDLVAAALALRIGSR